MIRSDNIVSIIIPSHNRADRIIKTLHSCIKQTYSDIEVLVIDDASADNTKDIVNELNDSRIDYKKVYYKQANKARNNGLNKSKGKYIQFLDSDDFLHREKLEKQVALLEKSGAECCVADYIRNDQIYSNRNPVSNIFEFQSIFTASPLYRADTLTDEFLWNEQLDRHQDFEFFLRYFAKHRKIDYLPEPLCTYVDHKNHRISDHYNKGYNYQILIDNYIGFLSQLKSNCVELSDSQGIDSYFKKMISQRIENKSPKKALQNMKIARRQGFLSYKSYLILYKDYIKKRLATWKAV